MIAATCDQLDTPALVVDLDALDANIATIAGACKAQGVRWRPHVKSHASPPLARRLLDAGAFGVTCAKLGEAEIMASAGVREILVANQVVGARKLERLLALERVANVVVALDDAGNAAALAAAAREAGLRVPVVVEVDTGMRRAGVQAGAAAVALAHAVSRLDGLVFEGFEAWEGHASFIADPDAKRAAIDEAVRSLTQTAEATRASGLAVSIVSCGGTATFPRTGSLSGVTEVQVGGGIFGDRRCREISRVDMQCALRVVTTVTSRPDPRRIVCDTGRKSMSDDVPGPFPQCVAHVESVRLSAEHAILTLSQASAVPRVGDRVTFEVGYSDSTILLHDEIHALRDGVPAAVWPVGGRGKAR